MAGRYTYVKIKISNSHSGNLKIYWKSHSSGSLSENNSASVYVNNKKKNYWLILPVQRSELNAIRLDPSNRKGIRSIIESIQLYSLTGKPVIVRDKQSFSNMIANEHINELKISDKGVRFTSSGNDPNFLIRISAPEGYAAVFARLLISLLLFLTIVFLVKNRSLFSSELRFVPYAMLLIAALATIMAVISRENAHPDEVTHINNAVYYSKHAAPAIACSPETLFTYTTYGVSRLDNREIAYYISGQYLHLLSAIPAATVFKLRCFNLALFFVLTIMTFRYVEFRFIMLPVLLTPQAWYIFSYFNSDALSLFVIFLAAFQIFIKDSLLRRLLRNEQVSQATLKLILLSLLVAMQFWVKLNFFFFMVFICLCLCSWIVVHRKIPGIKMPFALVCVVAGGIAIFSGWETWRHAVNDFQLAEKSMQCREITAGPLYKPSTPLEQLHPTFRLRDKGESLIGMIENHNWIVRIFYTGLGAYGYTEYMNDIKYYHVASFFITVFLIYLIVRIFILGNHFERLTVLCAFIAMSGLLFAAALNSWQQDLQAQGRYLLVFLPITGSLIIMNRSKLNPDYLFFLSMVPFLMALLSFIFIGMIEIPKV